MIKFFSNIKQCLFANKKKSNMSAYFFDSEIVIHM